MYMVSRASRQPGRNALFYALRKVFSLLTIFEGERKSEGNPRQEKKKK